MTSQHGRKATAAAVVAVVLVLVSAAARSCQAAPLPGAKPLEWPEEDLSARLMDSAHAFVQRKIAESLTSRQARWSYDFRSPEAYSQALQPQRQRLREIIGAVDPRAPVRMERFGDDDHPALVADTQWYRIEQVRWPVLEGVAGEGLLLTPKRRAIGGVVALPDADQTAEQLTGLSGGVDAAAQYPRRLAESGLMVIVPTLASRDRIATDDERLSRTDQTYREWVYRQAFHMGRHVIGYEVQQTLAAVDWLAARGVPGEPLGVAGYGEGGLIAFYSAALDSRIQAALISGYFDDRQAVWSEPIYRNVWSLLADFGDAEIASMILPRRLVIEYSEPPAVTDQKGELRQPGLGRVRGEVQRIATHPLWPPVELVHGPAGQPLGPASPEALGRFAGALGAQLSDHSAAEPPRDRRLAFAPEQRQRRWVRQMEDHVQALVRASDQVRDRTFLYAVMPELSDSRWTTQRQLPTHPAEKFVLGAEPFRVKFRDEAMGRFDEPLLPPNPRCRLAAETDKWTAWDVVLDVFPELFAWGVLVLPRDLQPGERRPVVVCQHGRNGLPRDTIDGHSSAYNDFAARLAEQGFITFAPHNLYRGEDRYRWLDRKANTIGCTLFSFIIAQHDQILRWLDSLPMVDGDRIAFYGLSYGGETAVRVPAVLEKYCLSICSGDFNQWTRKVAATDQPFSFMRTIEWEMPYWNLGHTFDYAEMGYLMIPRPFMVERGHLDRVGRDEWVAHEYAKVRWLYAQLGMADRTRIEFFQGGHSIRGEGTFDFLHRQLQWPQGKGETP